MDETDHDGLPPLPRPAALSRSLINDEGLPLYRSEAEREAALLFNARQMRAYGRAARAARLDRLVAENQRMRAAIVAAVRLLEHDPGDTVPLPGWGDGMPALDVTQANAIAADLESAL